MSFGQSATVKYAPRLKLQAAAELELRRRRGRTAAPAVPTDWRAWLAEKFPTYPSAPFAERHVRLWEWLAGLTPGARVRPRIEIWPRGGAKSSTAELGACYVGCTGSRRFVLYVCKTQAQADKHLQSIAALLETAGIERAVNKYQQSRGWTQQIIRAANGFNVVSLGLDAAARGIKLDQYRPDLIILDDIDDKHDSLDLTQKKIETLTESVLPTGAPECVILFIQNMIHRDSIAARLADGRADFLLDKEPPVVEQAVAGLTFERIIAADGTARYSVTGGRATWAGQDLATAEYQLNTWGRLAFLREAQHQVKDVENGLWNRLRDIEPFRVTQYPKLRRIVVGIDPSATTAGDEEGIVVFGEGIDGHGYLLADPSLQGSPRVWALAAVAAYHSWAADRMVAESNNGGEMVEVTISTIPGAPPVTLIHASRGKLTRAEPVQALYEQGKVHHVGVFPQLEDELCSYVPGDDSPNRMDALVWAATEVLLTGGPGFSMSYDRRLQERR
jgi:hypothetical protein